MTRILARTAMAAFALVLSLAALASPFPRLDQFGRSLNLTTAQQAQFNVAVAATGRVVIAAAMAGARLKALAQAEFAKPRPDLEALARLREANEEDLRPLHQAARAEWLALYVMLSDEQVATVKEHLQETFGHLDALHQFVMRLLLGRGLAGN